MNLDPTTSSLEDEGDGVGRLVWLVSVGEKKTSLYGSFFVHFDFLRPVCFVGALEKTNLKHTSNGLTLPNCWWFLNRDLRFAWLFTCLGKKQKKSPSWNQQQVRPWKWAKKLLKERGLFQQSETANFQGELFDSKDSYQIWWYFFQRWLIYLPIIGVYWGYNPLILTIDPNLHHPRKHAQGSTLRPAVVGYPMLPPVP